MQLVWPRNAVHRLISSVVSQCVSTLALVGQMMRHLSGVVSGQYLSIHLSGTRAHWSARLSIADGRSGARCSSPYPATVSSQTGQN
jgi:hypothetical protein